MQYITDGFIMNSSFLRRCETAALITISILLCTAAWAQARQQSVSASLVRLHVIAASDDEYEQALKLRVRDAVLEYISPALAEAGSSAEAQALITDRLSGIAGAAESAAEGRPVRVTLGTERYPTRVYEGFTLPAGKYCSLRVVLGEGQGHNWWCIVFPPVCLEAAGQEQLQAVMAEGDYKTIQGGGYELRFRVIELWDAVKQALE